MSSPSACMVSGVQAFQLPAIATDFAAGIRKRTTMVSPPRCAATNGSRTGATGADRAMAPRREHTDPTSEEAGPWQSLKWITQVIASRRFDGNRWCEEVLDCRAGSAGRSVRFAEPAAEPERSGGARAVERDAA